MFSSVEHRLWKSVDGLQSGHLASQLFPSSILSRRFSSLQLHIFMCPHVYLQSLFWSAILICGNRSEIPKLCRGEKKGKRNDGGRKGGGNGRRMRRSYLPRREWVILEAKSCHNTEPKHLFLVPSASQVSLLLSTHWFFFSPPGAPCICFLLISPGVADEAIFISRPV